MQKITLDRTRGESYKLLEGQKEISSAIKTHEILGFKTEFNFSDGCINLPICHIGLAQLAYDKAAGSFYTRRIEGGREKKVFEELPQGEHIADFLDSFTPDVLAWYQKKDDGSKLKFSIYPHNDVRKVDITNYDATLEAANNQFGENERELTLYGAFRQALNLYSDLLGRRLSPEQKDEMEKEEETLYQQKIDELRQMAEKEFGEQHQENNSPNLEVIEGGAQEE